MPLLFLKLFMAPHCVQDAVHTGPGSLLLTRHHLSPITPQAIIPLSDLLASQGSRTLSLYQVVPVSLPKDTHESVDSSLCAWTFWIHSPCRVLMNGCLVLSLSHQNCSIFALALLCWWPLQDSRLLQLPKASVGVRTSPPALVPGPSMA